jgi:hypothetical protein
MHCKNATIATHYPEDTLPKHTPIHELCPPLPTHKQEFHQQITQSVQQSIVFASNFGDITGIRIIYLYIYIYIYIYIIYICISDIADHDI